MAVRYTIHDHRYNQPCHGGCKALEWEYQICKVCHRPDKTYYNAPDELWKRVVPPGASVVCLSCFDDLATAKGIEYKHLLTDIGFVGHGCNYQMVP